MLCEGVMLYMMLVTVFGNKLNSRRFFFILGWGKPGVIYYMCIYLKNEVGIKVIKIPKQKMNDITMLL